MNIITKIIPVTLAASLSFSAFAEQPQKTEPIEDYKHWSIGAGAQTLTVTNDVKDIEFSGGALAGTYAFKNWMALRVSYHDLENDDNSDLESESFDIAMLWGTGLLEDGFKAYGGVGYFSDTWSNSGYSDEDFSGFTLTGGLGYSWNYVSLDLLVGARQVSDYEDIIEDSGFYGDVVTVTTSLTLSARF